MDAWMQETTQTHTIHGLKQLLHGTLRDVVVANMHAGYAPVPQTRIIHQ
jgi:hypothetical protein